MQAASQLNEPIKNTNLDDPPLAMSLDQAYAYCRKLALSHYENFPVASHFLPKKLRPHVAAVYAFSRIADDFADEDQFEGVRMARLKEWEHRLKLVEEGVPTTHPVFMALADTLTQCKIPMSLFSDLLTAFKMDVIVSRYQTFDQLLNYCRYSANPVGRIVLHIMGYPAPKFLEESDFICTALQLANFWQDVAVDLDKKRIYLPREDMFRFGYDEESLKNKLYDDRFRRLVLFQVDRTADLFERGKELCGKVPGRLGLELRMTWLGGMEILHKIRKMDGNVLHARPSLKKRDFVRIFFGALKKNDFSRKAAEE